MIALLLVLAFHSNRSVADAPPIYSLDDCLRKIQANSVQLAQSAVNEARAKAALDEAYKPRIPQLVGQVNIAQTSDIVTQAPDANKVVARVEQGTLPFGSAWRLGDQRRYEAESAELSTVASTQDVALLVKQLYFSILRDADLIKSSDRVERQLQRLLTNVLPRYQIGRAPSFDLVKVKSAIYDLARTRDVTQAQLVGEQSQLAQILGFKGAPFGLSPLKELPPLPLDGGSARDFSANPTLLSLQKDIEASHAAVSVARWQRLPALSAAAEYGLVGISAETMIPAWAVFGQLRFTIFDWGLIKAQVQQADAAATLAEKKHEQEIQRTSSEWARTWSLAQAHLADEKRLTALMPELDRTASVSVDRYRKAALGIIEVTDAINLWLQNLANERMAYYSYLSDLAGLERLSGESLRVRYEKP